MDNTFRFGDPREIDLSTCTERAYWCKALDLTEAQLVALVDAVGPSAQLVKDAIAAISREAEGRMAAD